MISSDSVAFWAYMTVEYVSAFIILSLLTPLEDCAFYDRLRRGAVWRTNVEDWNSSLGAVLVYKTNGSGRGEGQGSLEEAGADHRRRGASLCARIGEGGARSRLLVWCWGPVVWGKLKDSYLEFISLEYLNNLSFFILNITLLVRKDVG